MKQPGCNLPRTNLSVGDRVIATDGAGIGYAGHLHHRNGCGQFYVLPDDARQPFYAYPAEIRQTGEREPGFVDPPVMHSIALQQTYVAHMRRFSAPGR